MPLDPTSPPPPPPPSSSPAAGTVTSFQTALPEGHLVGAWRIDRVVATSATAVVYAATDVQLGTVVALKEYMPARLARREEGGAVVPIDAAAFQRGSNAFVAAARMLERCRQTSLVPVLGVGLANDTAYQAMAWIAGTSLRELRAAMPGPPDDTALRALLDNLLDALAAIHATGSIHGGVDPAKVLLQRDDRAVLLGPGSAAREGAPAGTVGPGEFTAPELSGQGGGDVPGPWSDLYALAAVARFCIVGDGASAEVPPARYSAALLAVIERALSPTVAARPQSVAAFRAALAGPAPTPETATSKIELDAERARIKRVVDSINFDENAEEPPRTEGLSRRSAAAPASRSNRAPGTVPPPLAPTARWRVGLIAGVAGVAVLGALGVWALVRSPSPDRALPPAPVAAAPGGLSSSSASLAAAASAPASSPKPTVEDSLAMAAAVLGAASEAPMASAPAASAADTVAAAASAAKPVPEPAAASVLAAAPANAASAETRPATPVAVAASAASKPRSVKRAAAAPAVRKPVADPRAACSGRSDFALYRCMKTQCAQARWTTHPQCVRLRQTDRVDG